MVGFVFGAFYYKAVGFKQHQRKNRKSGKKNVDYDDVEFDYGYKQNGRAYHCKHQCDGGFVSALDDYSVYEEYQREPEREDKQAELERFYVEYLEIRQHKTDYRKQNYGHARDNRGFK